MAKVWLNNKPYEAFGARKSSGLYDYTCDAFTRARRGLLVPVRSQIKLHKIAKILRGEKSDENK